MLDLSRGFRLLSDRLEKRQWDESSKSSVHVVAIAHILNEGLEFDFARSFDRGLVHTLCSIVVSCCLLRVHQFHVARDYSRLTD